MSNLTPEDVDLRLTSIHSMLDEEDTRLWEGLEDEKISRIAGDNANKLFAEQVQGENQGTESRLSTEVIHRSEGDINNITSLNALAQALSDYRIKTDLEINQEKIAREQLGIELHSRIGILESSFSHREFMIYQAISNVQTDVNFKYDALDVRVRKYEEMLQDITTDSIQITMDNGEINMGAWTILSQAREWDLEILANVKVYQDNTTGNLNQALEDLQNKLPIEQDIIDKAIQQLSGSQIIKDIDAKLDQSIVDIGLVKQGLLKETQDRKDELVGMAQDNANEFAKQSKELNDKLQAETNARILAVQRESAIRQQELLDEAADRTAEIDEKIAELEVEIGDLSVINARIDVVDGKVNELDTRVTQGVADVNAAAGLLNTKVDANKAAADTKHTALVNKTDATNASVKAEETARIAAIKVLNDGLTAEIQFRKDGDTANLTAINNYKTSNDAALANVRNELAVNVTATTANATAIGTLDVRLTTNESETATAKALAASATQKAETALSETAALATQMTTVNASLEDIQTDLGAKSDASVVSTLQAQVTNIDGKVATNTTAITSLNSTVATLDGTVKGHTTAITGLETKQTQQGTAITQLTTDTTALKNSITSIEGELDTKVDSAAFTQLSSTVTKNTNDIATNSSAITNLTTGLDLTNAEVNKKANSSTVTALDSKVTQQGNDIASQGSAITKLTNDLKVTDDKVNTKADASALTALDTKVTLVDGKVTSQGNQLTQLKNTVDGIELEIDGKADSSALTALDSKVTKQGTDIASNTSAITALTGKVTVVEGELTKKADATAVNNLTTRVETAEGKITSQGTAITKLTSDLATTDTKVNTKADAAALTALDTKVTQQGNTITSQGSAITKLTNDLSVTNQNVAKKADAAALTALTSTVTALDGKVVSNTSAITSLSGRVTSVEGTLTTKADASALNNYYTKVEANNATAGAISSFNATLRVGGTNLYKGTKSFTGSWWSAGNTVIDTTQTYKGFTVRKSTGQWDGIKQIFPANTFPVGSKVVLSFYAKGATDGQPLGVYTNGTGGATLVGGSSNQVTLTTEWKRYEFVATVNSSTDTIQLRPENTSLNGTVFLCGLMFEAATIPSDWSPAPEDLDAAFADQGSAIAANASAISTTNTEVTRINGVVTTHGTSITKLQTDLSVVDGKVNTKADSSALTALDSKVTTQGGTITSQGNAITKLTNDLATTNTEVSKKANTTALNALDTKVTEQDGKITAQGTSINKLTSDLALTNAEVSKKADASALTMLDTKVTGIDNKVTSQSTALTKLTSDVTALTGEVSKKADASALTTLDTKVTAIDGRVTSNTSAITSLNSRVTTAEGNINKKADASVLVNYSTKTETDTAIASSMTRLDSELQSRGNNLLADGGFEKYTATTGNAVVFKAEKYAGTQSLRFFRSEPTGNGNNNDAYIGNYFNISQGRILYIEVYARKDPTATVVPPANSNVRVGVNFRSAAGVFNWSGIDVPMATLTDSWVKYSGYITVPAGAIEARQWLSIASVNNVQNSSILLDNVYIYDATEGRSASLAGAANATAIQTLDTKVTEVDGKVVSQGTAVTKLESGLKGVIASSLDLIPNPAFDPLYDQMGFSVVGSTTAGVPAGCPFPYVSRLAARDHTPSFYGVPCKQGDVFELSALVACAEGGTVPFNHYVYKFTSPTANAVANGSGGQVQPTQSWTRTTWRFTVPANFNYIKPFLQVSQFAPFNTVWYATDWHCVNITAASKAQAIADANATAIQTLDSKVVQQGKDITSQSTAQTALTNRVSTVEGQVTLKADSSAVQQLDSRVTLSEGKITSNTNAITNLSGTVTSLDGKVSTKADASALNNYYTKVQADSATAGHISSFSAGLQVGGGNLYLKSKSFTGEPWIHGNTAPDTTQTYRGLAVRKSTGQWNGPYQNISGPLYPTGTKLVFSMYAKAETNGQIMGLYANNANPVTAVGAIPAASNQVALTTEWKRYIFTTSVASNTGNIQLRPENPSTTGTIYMCGLQLELGTVPSEWGDAASELIESYGETARITIDASLLDPDTYYAVITALPQVGRSYLSIENALTATNGKPAWSSHANGFSLRLAWTSNGSAYGSVGVERRIIDFAHKFAAQSPVFNVRQYNNSSNEAVYVRGGAKYNFVVSRGLAPRLLTADLVVSDQTIPFKLAYSASLLPVTTDTTVSANASAITTTNAEVTRINGVVVAQGTSITNLTATVAGKADTSAVNTLQATVTQHGQDIVANATATTNLTNRVAVAEGKIEANTTATSTLSNRVTELDGKITAQAAAITKVESDLTGLTTEIDKKANATALTSLETKVTEVDGKTNTLATSLSQLSTKVDGNSAAIAVQGTTLNGIQAEYSIKLDVNGMVSGIGLINTGSSSAISMNADMFYIGKAGAGGKKPFMVLTSPQTIGGVTYPAGTWIDVALIANATIGTAHIADASITNAKIKELDASKITTGILNANRIRVGATSTFDDGYNPATKARTFIAQPTVPYSVGDIWKNGTSTYICKTQRVAGSFTASEWDKVGDVTSENTAANSNALGGTTASTINTNIANADTKATNAASTATAADTKATAADTKATLAQSAANSANNQVNAWKFTGTTDIDGGKIRADTVTAVQIDVAELSAISANLGTLTTTTDKGSTTMTGSLTEVRDASGQLRVKLGVW